jgi:hypothetical protein
VPRLESLRLGRDASFFAGDSIAAEYSDELSERLPEAIEVKLVARCEDREVTSVNAFIGASKGRAKTLTFVETENGCSICGGYLDAPWVAGGWANDQRRRSFIFTLQNPLGVPPTKFAQKRDVQAAYMSPDFCFFFGNGEAPVVWHNDGRPNCGETYEAPIQGAALFVGDHEGLFRAARWELWETV